MNLLDMYPFSCYNCCALCICTVGTVSHKTQLASAGQKVKYSSGQSDRAHHEASMPFPGTAVWKHPEERSHISGTADKLQSGAKDQTQEVGVLL